MNEFNIMKINTKQIAKTLVWALCSQVWE